MNRTFEEWVARYNKKLNRDYKRDERFALFYLPDKGFCELMPAEKMLIVGAVSGDGRFWKKFTEDTARRLGLKVIGTFCARKEIRAWLKLFDFKIISIEDKNGFKRYHCEGKDGGWCLMTEGAFGDGRHFHYMTWEVKADD